MRSKYESLSIFEFQELYPDDASCYEYLSNEKWGNGFVCNKCGYNKCCKGSHTYSKQCNRCHHTESATSGTMFQGLKFSLLKAFYIIYYISTSKKGISSTELSRKLELRQKTCWFFKQKVMRAMKSSDNYPMEGAVEVDETVIGQQEEGVKGRKNDKKKLVAVAIEKKGKGVSRVYAKVIKNASSEELGGFMKAKIDTNADIKTDAWCGYKPLVKDFVNLKQEKSQSKGKNFPKMHRVIMGLKGWIRGIHHRVDNLQAYLDEYCYRFNRAFMGKSIFGNLLKRMANADPFPREIYQSLYQTNA